MTPVFILAGQSNAANLSSEVEQSLNARYGQGNYDLLRIHDSGAPLTRERADRLDWSNPTEMRQDLTDLAVGALSEADDRIFGGVLWVQGEADTYFNSGASRYSETLQALVDDFRSDVSAALGPRDTGVDAAPFTILELSENAPAAPGRAAWNQVIGAQRDVAISDPSVTTLDPDLVAQNSAITAASMFRDNLHYSDSFGARLAEALVQTLNPASFYAGGGDAPSELNGSDGDDVLSGSGIINGRAGNDVIVASNQRDTLSGGDGDDVLIGGEGGDDLRGGAGTDTASYAAALGRVNLDLRYGGTAGDAARDSFVSIENVMGSDWGDYIYGNAAANRLEGGGGDDRLRGDAGNDAIYGGLGNDEIIGGSGRDRLDGNDGDDQINGGAQADHIRGQAGQDQVWGGRGKDEISGGSGNDQLWGGEARDFIYGGQDNDQLSGEAGSDRLFGQSGDDRLTGGSETDWLYGGTGRDMFVFIKGADKDLVRDFENNVDTILLSDDLWTGNKTAEEVLSQFASRVDEDVVFDFGDGDILIVENTNFSALSNDIDIF